MQPYTSSYLLLLSGLASLTKASPMLDAPKADSPSNGGERGAHKLLNKLAPLASRPELVPLQGQSLEVHFEESKSSPGELYFFGDHPLPSSSGSRSYNVVTNEEDGFVQSGVMSMAPDGYTTRYVDPKNRKGQKDRLLSHSRMLSAWVRWMDVQKGWNDGQSPWPSRIALTDIPITKDIQDGSDWKGEDLVEGLGKSIWEFLSPGHPESKEEKYWDRIQVEAEQDKTTRQADGSEKVKVFRILLGPETKGELMINKWRGQIKSLLMSPLSTGKEGQDSMDKSNEGGLKEESAILEISFFEGVDKNSPGLFANLQLAPDTRRPEEKVGGEVKNGILRKKTE